MHIPHHPKKVQHDADTCSSQHSKSVRDDERALFLFFFLSPLSLLYSI